MADLYSKNINSGVTGTQLPEELLLQKMEDNRRRLQAMNTAMQQKAADLQKVQAEINELKNIYTSGKSW